MKRYIHLDKRIVPFSREFCDLQLIWQRVKRVIPRRNRKIIGIRIKPKEGMWVSYQLRLRGITHQNIADVLGVNRRTVTTILTGRGHSTRIEEALRQTLGYPTGGTR